MKIVGLMSGTSVDGLDLALCEVNGTPPHLQATLLAGTTIPYPTDLRDAILLACDPEQSSTPHISDLNAAWGRFAGEQICALLAEQDADCDLIASHGQTIWHNADATGQITSTLQIGEAAYIAEITGVTTISNFRVRDVAAGGHGAPLTAYVDWLLLRHPTHWRAVQNIGGIGNVTLLPPLSQPQAQLMAFDTGPGNVLIDSAMTLLTDGRATYDVDGQRAAAGTVNQAWLDEQLAHPYFHRPPPKTTGRELFSPGVAQRYVADSHLSENDLIASLTALTAHSISRAYHDFMPQPPAEVIVGGGGARNPTLMAMLADALPDATVLTHEDVGIDSDYKEALVFAVLGYESWHHRAGTLPEQTGARHGSVLGAITPASNYLNLLKMIL